MMHHRLQIPTAAGPAAPPAGPAAFWETKQNHHQHEFEPVKFYCHFCQHTDFIWFPKNKQPTFQYCDDCRGTCAECGKEVLHPRDKKPVEFCSAACQQQWKQIQICFDSIEKSSGHHNNDNEEECVNSDCEFIHEKIWKRKEE